MVTEERIATAMVAALKGAPLNDVRAITYEYSPLEKSIKLTWFIDREPTEDDFEDMGVITTGFLSHFGDEDFATIAEECVFTTMHIDKLKMMEGLVYCRNEVN